MFYIPFEGTTFKILEWGPLSYYVKYNCIAIVFKINSRFDHGQHHFLQTVKNGVSLSSWSKGTGEGMGFMPIPRMFRFTDQSLFCPFSVCDDSRYDETAREGAGRGRRVAEGQRRLSPS